MRDHVYPSFGDKKIDRVTTADVFDALLRDNFWHRKAATAKKVRRRISTVMLWAVAQGHRADDPAGKSLLTVLPRTNHTITHRKALPFAEVGATLAQVGASDAYIAVRLGFEFLVLTACRTGEVLGATWSEIDLDAAMWTIPAERAKLPRAHRVPLSDRALDILREMTAITGEAGGFVFASSRGTNRQLAVNTFLRLLGDLRIDATAHGFRSSFRDWAEETDSGTPVVRELSLGHVEGSEAQKAYRRTDMFKQRRELMQAWADFALDN